MVLVKSETLPYLSNEERLKAYQLLIDGCSHIYSKGKIQTDKALQVLDSLIPLTQKDPLFLAHLTSYVLSKTDNKDLEVFTTYVNSLSSADGTRFCGRSGQYCIQCCDRSIRLCCRLETLNIGLETS